MKQLNPIKIIILFTLVLIIVTIVLMFSNKESGGEQKPLTILAYAIRVLGYGWIGLSTLTPFFYKDWIKKYWFVNLVFLAIGIYIIVQS